MKHKKHAAQPPRPPMAVAPRMSARRKIILALCLILAAGASWGVLEFVVWNKLPGELVGTWEVTQGPPEYKEAVFEFYRSGKLIGRLNDNGNLRIMNAEVDVEEDKLHITTRQPSTGKVHVSVQTIRKIDERELVVADEKGRVMKMVRIP